MTAEPSRMAVAPRRKLSETVAQRIRDLVRDLPAGTRLPSVVELGEQLGVGRSTIREAVNRLETLGLVEARQGQGVFVADRAPAPPEPRAERITSEGIEARTLVEPELAAMAARRRSAGELARLGEILYRHAQHLEVGEGPIVEATEFHLAVVGMAGNNVLASVVRPFLQLAFNRGPALYQTREDHASWELQEHQAIFGAIAAGDADLARQRMVDHVSAMNVWYLDEVETPAPSVDGPDS